MFRSSDDQGLCMKYWLEFIYYMIHIALVFRNQPQMVKVTKKMDTEFDAPKVRESFMRTFVDSAVTNNNNG